MCTNNEITENLHTQRRDILYPVHETNHLYHRHGVYVDINNGPYFQQLQLYEVIMGGVTHCQLF